VSFNYGPLAATATRLLTSFGQTATQVQTTRDGASTSSTGAAVEIQITEGERSRAALNGTPIPARKYFVSAGLTPAKGARLTVGNNSDVIMDADPIRPGATTMAWIVYVRAG
jgi:hypothetical protein